MGPGELSPLSEKVGKRHLSRAVLRPGWAQKGKGCVQRTRGSQDSLVVPKHSHGKKKMSEGPRDWGLVPPGGAPGCAPKISWEPLTVYESSKDNLGAVRRTG